MGTRAKHIDQTTCGKIAVCVQIQISSLLHLQQIMNMIHVIHFHKVACYVGITAVPLCGHNEVTDSTWTIYERSL